MNKNCLPVTDDPATVRLLSFYFASVFTAEGALSCSPFENRYSEVLMEGIPISRLVAYRKFKSFKASSSTGPDQIHPMIFHDAADSLYVPLSLILQKSLDEGAVPSD